MKAALILLAFFAPASMAGAASPTLTFEYTATGNLLVTTPSGAGLTAGSSATIPFGTYQVVITDDASDAEEPVHMFRIEGPGVNLQTDLQGGDDKSELYSLTFEHGATYSFTDANQPQLPTVTFKTSDAPVAAATTTTHTQTDTGRNANADVVGSRSAVRGVLDVTVTTKGFALARSARNLKAGRYRLVVHDASARRGVSIVQGKILSRSITSAAFTGRRTVTVDFRRGRYRFSSGDDARVLVFS